MRIVFYSVRHAVSSLVCYGLQLTHFVTPRRVCQRGWRHQLDMHTYQDLKLRVHDMHVLHISIHASVSALSSQKRPQGGITIAFH